jgi:prevent-host-death family protein
VSVYDAKTHLSRLLVEVEAGTEVAITRNGRAVARLVAASASPRKPGRWAGSGFVAPDGWDEFTPEDAEAWFG